MYGQREEELPHEVILAIQRVLDLQPGYDEEDPLATLSNDFSRVDMLNSFFPDETSLAQIEVIQTGLVQNELELQQEIDALQLELKRDQDPNRMQLIQETISDLLGQMSRIREKANESEAVVRDITKDIQVLDLAKKNLILTMTTLKRLQMLVNALNQLEDLLKEKKYNEIGQTLAAVKQLSTSFKEYTAVRRISQVWKRIQEVQNALRAQIDADFETFYVQDPAKPIKPAVIAEACLVVDVLGPDERAHLLDRYVALELKEYRRIFRSTDEAGQLDNISRRFAWFRRLLQTHEIEQGRVFPADWRVGWHLLAKFIETTRDDMTALLSKAGSSLTVKLLLDTLQVTHEFEASMVKKWVTPLQDILNATASSTSRPPKPISFAFESHMGVFVDAQDKALSDMLAPYRGVKAALSRPSLEAPSTSSETSDANGGSPVIVLPSSTELFYFYGQSLEQCAKLSTGKPLYDLCTLHKKWLRIYADDVLLASLKRQAVTSRKSIDNRFDLHELKQACLLINTADYCQTTALELEEKIREKIHDEYKENITLQTERDIFVSVISTAIMVQLRELESACDPAFAILARTLWTNVNQVSGQSAYSGELVKSMEQVVEIVKPLVEQKKYLRNLFDKASSFILAKFTNALVKSRPLKEIGAEQLLIDLQTVKAYLLKMPGEALTTTGYTRALTKSTTRLEALLKVIVTPVDPPEGFILNYTLLIGDASFSNFQKILDLKGTPKGEQSKLLDSFLTVTSTKTELDSTSFLSSLDMDPPGAAQIGINLTSPGGSRVSLPSLVNGGISGATAAGESLFAALGSPPLSGPPTGDGAGGGRSTEQKREVFSDFRRFVSFGLRRETKDTQAQS